MSNCGRRAGIGVLKSILGGVAALPRAGKLFPKVYKASPLTDFPLLCFSTALLDAPWRLVLPRSQLLQLPPRPGQLARERSLQPWAGLSALRAPPCPRPSQAHPWSHARRPTARVRFPPSPRRPGLRDLAKLRRWATSCVDPGRSHCAHHPEGAREGGPRGVVSAAGRCPQPRPERPHALDPRTPCNPASRVP